jgi:hypothetical protein
MIAIVVKHSYDVIHVDSESAEALREVCDPTYDGPLTPAHILDVEISDIDPVMELTIVDEVEDDVVVIYDEQF